MTTSWRRVSRGFTAGLLVAQLSSTAPAEAANDKSAPARRAPAAAGSATAGNGQAGPSMADFNRLQNEVREQRQLMVEMLQADQQRYEMLLKLIRSQSSGGPAELPRMPIAAQAPAAGTAAGAPSSTSSSPPTSSAGSSAGAAPDGPGGARGRSAASASPEQRRTGTLAGRINVQGGGETSDIYVYVENVKSAPVHGKTLEIKQENKQFSPRLAVVQTGTSVTFPNLDAVYHNVFSNSPQNSFDLGSSRAGDAPRAVTLTKPGVVEVFCNMHQKMTASVLVVPSPHFAKVRPDGTFRIDNVPVGTRKVVAWSPRAKSAAQQVEVTGAGAEVTFALQVQGAAAPAHLNKLGQAYGSYRE